MAGTMNNMELTRAVEVLNQQLTVVNGQVTDLSNRLHVAVPDMNTNIQTSADALTSMFNAIKSVIQPVIDQFQPLQNSVIAFHTEASSRYQQLQRLGETWTQGSMNRRRRSSTGHQHLMRLSKD